MPAYKLISVFIVAVLLNYLWELAQAPLYVGLEDYDAGVFWHCFVASLGDGIMVLLIVVVGWISFQRWNWFERPGAAGYLLMLLQDSFLRYWLNGWECIVWVAGNIQARCRSSLGSYRSYPDRANGHSTAGDIPHGGSLVIKQKVRNAYLSKSRYRASSVFNASQRGVRTLVNEDLIWPRKGVTLDSMERHAKNVTGFILAAFLTLGILCSTFTAPGQALASASDCSENPSPMTMVGCENPSFLCGFNPASNLVAYGALTTARSADSVKDTLGLAVGASVIDISGETAPLGVKERNKVSLAEPGKVSIHLLNSILNL